MSQFKTFLLPLEPDTTAEEELNAFLRGHRVVDVQRICFPPRGWCFCVEWLDGAAGGARSATFTGRIDYMKELEPAVFAVFSKLRSRRKELAKEAGVPPFGVATDAQLAEMAKMEEPTLAKIGKIEGFGEARMKAYGDKLLAVMREGMAARPEESPQPHGARDGLPRDADFPHAIRLSKTSRSRYVRKTRALEWMHWTERIGEAECQSRETAIVAFTKQADSTAWRRVRLAQMLA